MIQKSLIGLGASFLFWWIWTITNMFLINLLLFIGIFGGILIVFYGYHAYNFLSTCKKCEFLQQWDKCPGFADHVKYLKKNNLPNIFTGIKYKKK
jgi:hypothetical protein